MVEGPSKRGCSCSGNCRSRKEDWEPPSWLLLAPPGAPWLLQDSWLPGSSWALLARSGWFPLVPWVLLAGAPAWALPGQSRPGSPPVPGFPWLPLGSLLCALVTK